MDISNNKDKTIRDFLKIRCEYIWMFDANLNFYDCSDSLLELRKEPRTALMGRSLKSFLSENKDRGLLGQYENVLKRGQLFYTKYTISQDDGTTKHIELKAQRISNGITIIEKDISALHKAKIDSNQNEQNLSLIAKHSPDYFTIIDTKGHIIFIDKVMPGYTWEQIRGASIYSFQDKKNTAIMRQCIDEVILTQQSNNYEILFKTPKEGDLIFEGRVVPIIEDGIVLSLAISAKDITEKKNTETDLKNTKNQYWDLLKQTNTIFFSQDKNLRYISIINTQTDFNEKDVIGKTDQELLPQDKEDAIILEDFKKSVLNDGIARREDIRLIINGMVYYYDLFVKAIKDEHGVISGISCVSMNITNRKNGENALKKSRNQLMEAEKIAQLGQYDIDLSSKTIKWSNETFRIFGIAPSKEAPNMAEFQDLIHEEDKENVLTFFEKSIAENTPFDMIYRIIRSDGNTRYIQSFGKVEKKSNGKPLRFYGTMQDITTQKMVEFKLKEQKEFIQKITDLSPNLIFILEIEKKEFVFYNNASQIMLGYNVEELQKMQNDFLKHMTLPMDSDSKEEIIENTIVPKSLIHPDDIEISIDFFEKLSQSIEDKVYEFEHRVMHKSGHWVWLLDKAVPFSRDKNGQIKKILVISNDISQLKKVNQDTENAILAGQEKEQQRIAADLHDALNPLLSITKMSLESLKDSFHPSKKEERLKLENAIELLARSMAEIKEISSNLMPKVLLDFGLIQAIKNLCANISDSGTISINFDSYGLKERLDKKTEVGLFRIAQELLNNIIKHANASTSEIQLIQRKKNLIMMVDDNGIGFNKSRDQLIHNGFGFRNIESRVKSLNGKMEIDSLEGRGTTITIAIPTNII